MKILAIIPARGGSKGIPRKNIKPLNGKPLIAWTIEEAKKSTYINKIIVSSEDSEIIDISIKYGAEVPFVRPKQLSEDTTPGLEPVLYSINKLRDDLDYQPDIVVLLQPTSPLRTSKHIDDAIEQYIANKDNYDSLVSITELEHPITWNRIIADNKLSNFIEYNKATNTRRQDTEKIYRLNGAIYISSYVKFVTNQEFENNATIGYIMDRKSSLDIDTIDDFELAEFYISKTN